MSLELRGECLDCPRCVDGVCGVLGSRVLHVRAMRRGQCPEGRFGAAPRGPEQQAAILDQHCDPCRHSRRMEHDRPACALLRGCGGGAACPARMAEALQIGHCPLNLW